MDTLLPTQIIILGGGGDLSKHKLLPALFDLFVKDTLPSHFNIIGFARTPRTNEEYRSFVFSAILSVHTTAPTDKLEKFCSHVTYVAGDFDIAQSYLDLKQNIDSFETRAEEATNKLFYLAVPPRYYKEIFQNLSDTNAVCKCSPENGWSRILVEKPFGKDLETAIQLEKQLSSLFTEDQIFRIDHYLAKEAVQNILSFRFANTLFKDVWNKDSIRKVHITMHEEVDIGTRGSFYDGIGAIRDVGQNHLLQLLALVAMEEPKSFDAEEIRTKRAYVLKHIAPITDYEKNVLRAQYEGYSATQGVQEDSKTETYFILKTFVTTPRWENVPFIIASGKALKEKKVVIEVFFKDIATGLFDTESCNSTENKMTLFIEPTQLMQIRLNAKAPGLGYQLHQRELSFECISDDEVKNAYEKVLLDCIAGDQTLFTSTQEVFAAWDFITPILKNLNTLPLHTYPKGSDGPKNDMA